MTIKVSRRTYERVLNEGTWRVYVPLNEMLAKRMDLGKKGARLRFVVLVLDAAHRLLIETHAFGECETPGYMLEEIQAARCLWIEIDGWGELTEEFSTANL